MKKKGNKHEEKDKEDKQEKSKSWIAMEAMRLNVEAESARVHLLRKVLWGLRHPDWHCQVSC